MECVLNAIVLLNIMVEMASAPIAKDSVIK
jgi:hypothetical protein